MINPADIQSNGLQLWRYVSYNVPVSLVLLGNCGIGLKNMVKIHDIRIVCVFH